MLIAYCETCGFRIPEADLSSGAAAKVDENRYFCAKCNAASNAKRPPTKILTKQTIDSARAQTGEAGAAPGRAVPPAGRPIAAGSHASSASMPAARAATAPKAVKNKSRTMLVVGASAGALGLLLICVFVFSGGKNNDAPAAVTSEKSETVAKAGTKPAPGNPASSAANVALKNPPAAQAPVPSAANTPAAVTLRPDNAQERIRNADKEMEAMRDERAARLLEEHKAWFAAHSEDPWSYREKLGALIGTYRSAPAGIEAAKLLLDVKLPEGERNPDSMVWHRDWEITRGLAQDMLSDFDGRRYVLATHPLEPGKPFILKRRMKVPADKPVLEFNARANEAGDFKLIVVVAGKTLVDEVLGGKNWRAFSLDLSALKGRDADVELQHHNTDWNGEHGWFQAPRFVEKPATGAKVAAFDGAAPVAATPDAAAPANAQNRVWKTLIDGKSLAGVLKEGFGAWKAENGALIPVPGQRSSAQTQLEFEDGDIRVRFEVKDVMYLQFTARQGESGGYSAPFDRSNLPQMEGRQNELIFSLRGDEVRATINGQPAKIEAAGKPRRGRLQFYGRDGTFRVLSVEFSEPGAVVSGTPPVAAAVNLALDAGFESGNWGAWNPWGQAGVYKGTEHAHGGNHSGAINTEKNGLGQVLKGLTPGATYELSGWGKVANAGEFFQLGVKEYGGPEKFESFNTVAFTKASLKFTMGANSTTATIFGYKTNGPGMGYIDDVSVVPEGTAPPAAVAVAGGEGAAKSMGSAAAGAAPGGDLKLRYEQILADVSALQFKNGVTQSIARLESARSDPKLEALSAMLERDVKLARLLEEAHKAAAKGAAALVDKRPFTLHKTDGKDLNVGKGSSNTVTEVKDETIVIEQDLGGGKALTKWSFEQLTAQSRYDLAKVGLAPGAETDLKLASSAIVLLQNGVDVPQKMIRLQLDAAKKGGASAELVAHLIGRLEARELEAAAETAYKKLDGLLKDKKWADAKAFIAAYRKDYSGTLALAKVAAALEQKSNDVEYALNPAKPGLWASFWSGDEGNKFKTMHFARAEAKMCWDFGQGSPDPRVPGDNFGIKWAGKLKIDKPGVYKFRGGADDRIELHVDGQMIFDNNAEKDVTLTKGEHDFKLVYWEQGGGANVNFHWKMDGAFDWQEIPADRMMYDPRSVEKYQKD